MKILYFHQHFSTPNGVGGIRSYEMARRLLQEGHSVTMVCGSKAQGVTGLTGPFVGGRRRGTVDGIDVVELDLSYANEDGFLKRTGVFVRFALASVGLALREECDVVFATTTPLTASIPGIFARWLRGKPFIFEVRDLWPELPRAMGVITNPLVLGAMSLLEWISYHSATRCIGLSPGIAEGIERRGIDSSLISMVPNGCDTRLFAQDGQKADRSFRASVGISEEQLLAVYSGTHGNANGLGAVIDAAIELQKRGRSDIVIALIGRGKEKAALQERVKREGLTNVRFCDPVPKSKLAGILAEADIGLQVLRNIPEFCYGTSPNKFFDYISAGLPVLNNYPGWLADMIGEQEMGFTVEPDSPSSFADALQNATLSKNRLREMGRKALAFAHGPLNRDVLSKQWVDWVVNGVNRQSF